MRTATALLAIALTSPLAAEAGPVAGSQSAPQRIEIEHARQIAEEARLHAEIVRQNAEEIRRSADLARQDAEIFRMGQVAVATPRPIVTSSANDGSYSSAHGALQQRQYERAITQFDRSIVAQSPRADAALYWRAFAQHKLGQQDLAVSSIAQLRRDYPKSRYLADAKTLETDAKRTTGRSAAADDEEIKMLAIQGVQRSAQAVPVLEGVLTATNSLALKKRALGALASIDDPRARTVLMSYAKGSGNPDLQTEAIRVLASRRDMPMSEAELTGLYGGNTDATIKRSVISALASQENAQALVTLARQETDLELKRDIVRRLSDLAPRSKVAADFLTGVLQ